MKLKSLKLVNFRNYEDTFLEFSPGINIFIGDNGSGKTNILEAIYVLSLTKSTRPGNDLDLININHDILLSENSTKISVLFVLVHLLYLNNMNASIMF